MVTPKGSMSTEGETFQVSVLPYRCSICPPLVMRQMWILYSSSCHTRYLWVAGTWLQDWHLPHHQGCTYRAPVNRTETVIRCTCVSGTWLKDLHLPRHQGWTYGAPVRQDRNLECLSLCWHAPLRRDHPGTVPQRSEIPEGLVNYPVCSVKLWNYIVIRSSQFIRSLTCISSYMFRLVYRVIFRLVFRVVCMYDCWWFESNEISYYK